MSAACQFWEKYGGDDFKDVIKLKTLNGDSPIQRQIKWSQTITKESIDLMANIWDIKCVANSGNTILHYYTQNSCSSTEIFEYLCGKYELEMMQTNKSNESVIMKLIQNSSFESRKHG
eukprot:411117_1